MLDFRALSILERSSNYLEVSKASKGKPMSPRQGSDPEDQKNVIETPISVRCRRRVLNCQGQQYDLDVCDMKTLYGDSSLRNAIYVVK